MTELLFITAVALLITLGTGSSRAGERDQTRSYYDQRGSFAGSSSEHRDGTSSFYDRDGKFSGSSIRNSDGTTSYYGSDGKFRGSSTSTNGRHW
jgi:hypothetical protein